MKRVFGVSRERGREQQCVRVVNKGTWNGDGHLCSAAAARFGGHGAVSGVQHLLDHVAVIRVLLPLARCSQQPSQTSLEWHTAAACHVAPVLLQIQCALLYSYSPGR